MSILIALAGVTAIEFNIPAGAATDTVVEWSRQAHVQVLFDFNVVRPWSTPALQGQFTPTEALMRMLSGTELTADLVNDHTAAVYEAVHYCHPEWGAAAPLPPCVQPPLVIRAHRDPVT